MNDQLITHGQRIRERREKMRLSQIEIGKRVGIKSSSMSNIEIGKTKRPSGVTLMRLASVLELSPEWIVSGKGEKQLSNISVDEEKAFGLFNRLTDPEKSAIVAAMSVLVEKV